jgi:hypothetical protein
MTVPQKTKTGLDNKFAKVKETPVSFAFYIAIHDFIAYIEANPALLEALSKQIKINRELGIPDKYVMLRQIYQAIEDMHSDSTRDLGHDRYSVIRDMNRIQGEDHSDSNAFWKKRELFRKTSGEIYERLNHHLSGDKSEASAMVKTK